MLGEGRILMLHKHPEVYRFVGGIQAPALQGAGFVLRVLQSHSNPLGSAGAKLKLHSGMFGMLHRQHILQ